MGRRAAWKFNPFIEAVKGATPTSGTARCRGGGEKKLKKRNESRQGTPKKELAKPKHWGEGYVVSGDSHREGRHLFRKRGQNSWRVNRKATKEQACGTTPPEGVKTGKGGKIGEYGYGGRKRCRIGARSNLEEHRDQEISLER